MPTATEQEAQVLSDADAYSLATASDGVPLTVPQIAARHEGNVNLDLGTLATDIKQSYSQNRGEQRAATKQMNAALTQKVKADLAAEHVRDKFLQEKVVAAKNEVDAQQKAEAHELAIEDDVIKSSTMVRDKSLEMMNEHPEKIWSNATTGGKIAGVIGLVLAGFSGYGAHRRLNEMVNDAVAVQDRKNKFLQQTGEANDTLLSHAEKVFTSQRAAHEAVRASLFDAIDKRLDVAMQGTKDKVAYANLAGLKAQAAMDGAKHLERSHQIEKGQLISLAAQRVGMDKAQAMLQSKAAMAQDHKVVLPGIVGADGNPVQLDNRDQNVRKFAVTIGHGAAFLRNGKKMDKFITAYRNGTLPTEERTKAMATYRVLRKQLDSSFKGLYEYGGAFTGGEKEPLIAMNLALPLELLNVDMINSLDAATIAGGMNSVKEDLAAKTQAMTGGKARFNNDDPFWTESEIPDLAVGGSYAAPPAQEQSAVSKVWNQVIK